MRGSLAIVLLLSSVLALRGDEGAADDPDAVVWGKAFSSISATDDDSLVILVITNDDPYISPSAPDEPQSPLWCTSVFSAAFRKAMQARPDVRERISLQPMAAGMPALLTGGELRNQPARAVIAICDGNYRLLAFTVGVPETPGLLTLIEDAEEVRLLSALHREAHEKIVAAVAQRSSQRVSRMWRGVLEQMLVALGADNLNDDADVPQAITQRQIGRLTLLSETYAPAYLADVRLRFGLSESADRTRLSILEQHPEARRPWCESMIPFLAGNDFLTLWSPLCETLWGVQPVVRDAEAAELLDWWDLQIKTDALVLSLQPPLLARRHPWPPVDPSGQTSKRGLGWNDVQELVVQRPYRTVDAQQLAVLIQSRELKPVDIQLPTMARYLFFEPKKKGAVVVREGDPPGRFVGQLKRAK